MPRLFARVKRVRDDSAPDAPPPAIALPTEALGADPGRLVVMRLVRSQPTLSPAERLTRKMAQLDVDRGAKAQVARIPRDGAHRRADRAQRHRDVLRCNKLRGLRGGEFVLDLEDAAAVQEEFRLEDGPEDAVWDVYEADTAEDAPDASTEGGRAAFHQALRAAAMRRQDLSFEPVECDVDGDVPDPVADADDLRQLLFAPDGDDMWAGEDTYELHRRMRRYWATVNGTGRHMYAGDDHDSNAEDASGNDYPTTEETDSDRGPRPRYDHDGEGTTPPDSAVDSDDYADVYERHAAPREEAREVWLDDEGNGYW